MKLLKRLDRGITVLGLLLFGTLTGLSFLTTVCYTTQYEEIPYQKADFFPVVLLVCAVFTFLLYRVSQ